MEMTVDTSPLQSLLQEIQTEQRRFAEVPRPPASPARVDALRVKVRQELGVELPDDYCAFLQASNGLDFNGAVVYDCDSSAQSPSGGGFWQGLVAANQVWRQDSGNRDLLVFGDTDMDLIALHLPSGEYRLMDRVGHDRYRGFSSFAQMLSHVLRARLAN